MDCRWVQLGSKSWPHTRQKFVLKIEHAEESRAAWRSFLRSGSAYSSSYDKFKSSGSAPVGSEGGEWGNRMPITAGSLFFHALYLILGHSWTPANDSLQALMPPVPIIGQCSKNTASLITHRGLPNSPHHGCCPGTIIFPRGSGHTIILCCGRSQ
jgi:hypothetical protein